MRRYVVETGLQGSLGESQTGPSQWAAATSEGDQVLRDTPKALAKLFSGKRQVLDGNLNVPLMIPSGLRGERSATLEGASDLAGRLRLLQNLVLSQREQSFKDKLANREA